MWFKKRKSSEDYITDVKWKSKKRKKEEKKSGTLELRQKTVLFFEQSVKVELATTIRTLLLRLAPTLKFGVKVMERTGSSLRSKFDQGSLWDGAGCGRQKEDCVTCHQDCEVLPPSMYKSVSTL